MQCFHDGSVQKMKQNRKTLDIGSPKGLEEIGENIQKVFK